MSFERGRLLRSGPPFLYIELGSVPRLRVGIWAPFGKPQRRRLRRSAALVTDALGCDQRVLHPAGREIVLHHLGDRLEALARPRPHPVEGFEVLGALLE